MSHHLGLNSIKKTGSTALVGDVTLTGGTNVTLTQTGNDISIASAGGGGSSAWGDLTGTLADQTDLQSALDAKAATSHTQALSTISDVTASAAEVNTLDGITSTVTELNYTDGVTGAIQTQLNAKAGITPRVGTVASSATPSINSDIHDAYSITALAAAITSVTTNLTGTPSNFQKLVVRIKDDGTARAITWGASFQSGTATLPTTTIIGKTLMVGLMYDSVDSKWTCEATGSRA